jgi:uncharacterized protein involved in outer membrane biogenesis
MKKLFIILFALLCLAASIVLLLPVFFDANKYIKPYVERAIASKLDVEPHLGRFSVSLWGKLAVNVAGVDLIDKQTKKSVFKVADASIELPIPPLFNKIADVTVFVREPQISAIKLRGGQLNFMRLLKSSQSTGSGEAPPAAAAPLALLKDFKISITTAIEDAKINYRDEVTGEVTTLSNFDFLVKDFSLDEPFKYKITARLNSSQGGMHVSGPAEVAGTIRILKNSGEISGIDTAGKINLDSLELGNGSFEKQKGEPLNFAVAGTIFLNHANVKIDSNVESIRAKTEIDIKSYSPFDSVATIRAPKIDLEALMKMNAKLTDVNVEARITPTEVQVRESRLKVFKGEYSGTMNMNYKLSAKTFSMKGKISGIDVNEAITSQAPDLKNSLVGSLNADFSLKSSGAAAADYKKNLTGEGVFTLKDGSWSALYALKMIGEKLAGIPGAKERIGDLKVGDKIQTGKSNFKIANQNIQLWSTIIDMKDTKATVIGGGDVGFNKQLKFKGFLIAPLGSPPPELKNSDGRAKIPFEVSGAVNSPNVNWNVTTDAVAKAYLKQEGGKALEKLIKDNIQDENIKKIIEKAAPEGLDKLLKDIKL